MTEDDIWLNRLAEECSEVAQRVSKALNFTLEEIQPGQPLNNAERIEEELNDLIAVAILLHRRGMIPWPIPSEATIEAKRLKIEKYIAYSRMRGAVQPKSTAADVDRILDGWFGESLDQSEHESRLRRYLYDPLRKLVA